MSGVCELLLDDKKAHVCDRAARAVVHWLGELLEIKDEAGGMMGTTCDRGMWWYLANIARAALYWMLPYI